MRAALLLLALLLLAPTALADHAGYPDLTATAIRARLDPPFTFYDTLVTDPDGDALPPTWSNTNLCGLFTFEAYSARWDHGPETDCEHDTDIHRGTVTMRVEDASGHLLEALYHNGSADGLGDAPITGLTAQATADLIEARSVPFVGPMALLVGALAALARRR